MAKKRADNEPGREGRKGRKAARASIRRRSRDLSRKRKLAYILSQEVRRIVEDLELREWLLMEIWTKMRVREPLLNVLKSRYEQVKPDDLLSLPVECLDLCDRFYRLLDEFWLYLRTTEDMPTAMSVNYRRYRMQLKRIAEPLLEALDTCHGYESPFPSLFSHIEESVERPPTGAEVPITTLQEPSLE